MIPALLYLVLVTSGEDGNRDYLFKTAREQDTPKLKVESNENIVCEKFKGWAGQAKKKCISAETPSKCIRANELCAWCADETFQYNRCESEATLERHQCINIETTSSKVTFEAHPDDGRKSRIHPLNAQAEIRVGHYVDVNFTISEPEIYPVELYYLMDVSYSMREDMETMKSVGSVGQK